MMLFGFFAVVLFWGCGREQQKTSSQQQKSPEQMELEFIQKAAGQKSFTIAGIVFQEDQFMRLVQMGMKDAADKLIVDLKQGNSLNSVSNEISLIDTYIANKVDAIVITPLNKKSSIEALKRAHEKGIKIITFNTDIDATFQSTFVESDQKELGLKTGQMVAEYIKKNLGGNAKIAILEFMALVPEQSKARVDGFKEGIGSVSVDIVSEQDAWLAPQATNVVENILTAHPDVNIIWAANEGGTVGAVTAVNNKGKAGKVVVFGTDMSKQLAGFLLAQDGVLQAVTGQQPYMMGQVALESAVKILKGEEIPKRIIIPSASYSRAVPESITAYLDDMKELESK